MKRHHHHPLSKSNETQKRLADVILQRVKSEGPQRPLLSLSDMASALNISRDSARNSLLSLQTDGLIRIDRNRILINERVLEKMTYGNETG